MASADRPCFKWKSCATGTREREAPVEPRSRCVRPVLRGQETRAQQEHIKSGDVRGHDAGRCVYPIRQLGKRYPRPQFNLARSHAL